MTKQRSPGNTAVSISLPAALLADIDRRADALGLTRSQYLCHLARRDVESRGNLVITEHSISYKIPAKPA